MGDYCGHTHTSHTPPTTDTYTHRVLFDKMRQNIVLLVCIAGVISKEDWTGRQKDVKDMSDADLHKLLEEWDKDEEPIPPDELPDGHPDKPRPPLNISKKGQTVMLFVKVSDFNGDRDEVAEISSLWQTGLMNNHVTSERFQIEDDRVMFLFHDGADAWEAKDFFVEQDRCEEVQLEQKTYHGKVFKAAREKKEKEAKKKEKEETKQKKKTKKSKAKEEL